MVFLFVGRILYQPYGNDTIFKVNCLEYDSYLQRYWFMVDPSIGITHYSDGVMV